jgi:hypothetical protein
MPGGAPGDEHHQAGGVAARCRTIADFGLTLLTIAIGVGSPVNSGRCLRQFLGRRPDTL